MKFPTVCLLCAVFAFFGYTGAMQSTKNQIQARYKEGIQKGTDEDIAYALNRFIDGKILLKPPAVDGATYYDCLFLDVIRHESTLLHVGDYSKIFGCTFLGANGISSLTNEWSPLAEESYQRWMNTVQE